MPAIFQLRQGLGGADQRGHVDVVSAGVHDTNVLTGLVLGACVAGIWNAGFLLHGKRIQLRAHEDRGTTAVLHHCDHAVCLAAVGILADIFGDGVARLAQSVGDQCRCLLFLFRQLGMLVEILVGRQQLRHLPVHNGGRSCAEDRAGRSREIRANDSGLMEDSSAM